MYKNLGKKGHVALICRYNSGAFKNLFLKIIIALVLDFGLQKNIPKRRKYIIYEYLIYGKCHSTFLSRERTELVFIYEDLFIKDTS